MYQSFIDPIGEMVRNVSTFSESEIMTQINGDYELLEGPNIFMVS